VFCDSHQGESGLEGMMMHMDNCQVRNSGRTSQRLEEFQVIRLVHPPYSPDISPCDFWFFGWSKDMMKGHQFQSPGDIRAFLIDLSSHLDESTLISVYERWIAGLEEAISDTGCPESLADDSELGISRFNCHLRHTVIKNVIMLHVLPIQNFRVLAHGRKIDIEDVNGLIRR
jgi:hypothetical protein